ncbi:unnamed protein product [Pedinophyceae sp. YPF-701]|nr:unnamed protein product [Pedinophyceae sp. YPF-701]
MQAPCVAQLPSRGQPVHASTRVAAAQLHTCALGSRHIQRATVQPRPTTLHSLSRGPDLKCPARPGRTPSLGSWSEGGGSYAEASARGFTQRTRPHPSRRRPLRPAVRRRAAQGEGGGRSTGEEPGCDPDGPVLADLDTDPAPQEASELFGEKQFSFDRGAAARWLYVAWVVCCGVERTWRFGLPLILAQLPGGFASVATLGFVAQLSMFLLGPLIGVVLDSIDRRAGLLIVLIGQNLMVVVSCMLVAWCLGPGGGGVISPAAFAVMAIIACAQRILNAGTDVAIERDWTVVLANKNTKWLVDINANTRRIDQLAEIAGTFLFGLVFTKYGSVAALLTMAGLVALSCPAQLLATAKMSRIMGEALFRPTDTPGAGMLGLRLMAESSDSSPGTLAHQRLMEVAGHSVRAAFYSVRAIVNGWRLFFAQRSLLPSLAYIALFFNAVLSPGGLMTAYQASKGLPGTTSALFRGSCAAMGFVGVWLADVTIKRLGLVRAGFASLGVQAAALLPCMYIYFARLAPVDAALGASVASQGAQAIAAAAPPPVEAATGIAAALGFPSMELAAFCGLVVVSRVGLWMYDMCVSQVFQTMVPSNICGQVSSAEAALCSLTELLMLGIASLLSDPANFGRLVVLSGSAVAVSLVIYAAWGLQLRSGEGRAGNVSMDEERALTLPNAGKDSGGVAPA